MTLEQIKQAVENGKIVHWVNSGYTVIKDNIGQWFIMCNFSNHCIGLTWVDGITMNGKPEEFYIAE